MTESEIEEFPPCEGCVFLIDNECTYEDADLVNCHWPKSGFKLNSEDENENG